MNKKAILITAIAVLIIGIVAALMLSGVIDVSPKSATEKEFGKRIINAEMVIEGYEDTVIKIELYPDVAPKTVKNFVKLCDDGFYDGLLFHRIVPNAILQTGSPNGDGKGGSDEIVKGEFEANGVKNTIRHRRGVLSMARLETNYNSATSQFFIVICPEGTGATYLDGEYAAFGRIVEGMEVIDTLQTLATVGETFVNPPAVKTIRVVD